jgi:signal transduction histidine kinase
VTFAPVTLQGRLTLLYAATLVAGLIVFAAVVTAYIDRSFKSELDLRLMTAARATAAIPDMEAGEPRVDAMDRRQLQLIWGSSLAGAVLDARRAVIASNVPLIPKAVVAAASAVQNEPDWLTVTTEGKSLRMAVVPLLAGGHPAGQAIAWRESDPVEDPDRLAVRAFAILVPLFAILFTIVASQVAARALAPVRDMAATVSGIEAGDLSRRLPPPVRQDELGRLGAAFNRMLDRLQAAFERQRQFTADASHELRSPLAVVRAEADLALQRERTPAEYRRALQAIVEEADRLESLVADLLAAARAEQAPAGEGVADLTALASKAASRVEALARRRDVRVHVAGNGRVLVRGRPEEIARIPLALIHNAIEHASHHGRVEVAVVAHDGWARLTVDDDGPGFTPAELAHATERFWRGDSARGRSGTGLGLAIAAAIARSTGGSITLGAAPAGGARVTIELPLSDA